MNHIHVRLTNRWAYFRTEELFDGLREVFSFKPKNYFFSPKYQAHAWDGTLQCIKRGRTEAGLFVALRRQAEEALGIQFVVEDERVRPQFHPFGPHYCLPDPTLKIRPFQRECVEKLIKRSRIGGLVLNATGTGKTLIAGVFLRLLKGSAVFVVDELTLMDQAVKALEKVTGEPIGVIGNSRFEPRRLTVATVQTLHRNLKRKEFKAWAKQLQVMILDEVHINLNKRSFQTVLSWKPPAVFGLTATLEESKDYVWFPAVSLCGPVIFRYNYEEGRKEKYLTPGVLVGVDLLRNIPKERGAAAAQQAYEERVVCSAKRNQCIEDLARKAVALGHSTAVLVERRRHVQRLHERLADLQHRVVSGAVSKLERVKAKDAFEAGKVKLLICSRVFAKGIDLTRLSVIIDGTGFPSKNSARQKFGRGVRLFENKEGLMYFDIGDRKLPDGENRFVAATRTRRNSLRSMGVPFLRLEASLGAKAIFRRAEAFLVKVLEEFHYQG